MMLVVLGWCIYAISIISLVLASAFTVVLCGMIFGGVLELAKGKNSDLRFYFETLKGEAKFIITGILFSFLLHYGSFYILDKNNFGVDFKSYRIRIEVVKK